MGLVLACSCCCSCCCRCCCLHAPWSKRPPVIFRLRFQPSGPCGPFPGLAWRIVAAVQRGAAPSKNFCQAMKFFVHVIVHVPSPVLLLPSRSLLAARCLLLWALWQREPPMAGSIGFRYSFTMGNIAEQPHCDSGWSSSCCLLAFGIFNFMFCCCYCSYCCCCCCRVSVKHDKHFF